MHMDEEDKKKNTIIKKCIDLAIKVNELFLYHALQMW